MVHQTFLNLNQALGDLLLYLDPGSGSILVQLLLAALLGAGVAVRMFWGKIKSFFNRKSADPALSIDEQNER